MANYFAHFPSTYYSKDKTTELDVVTNITARLDILQSIKNDPNLYDEYSINDGDTPEMLAHHFYNDPEKHWIILIMNDIVDAQYDWPLKQNTLIIYINDKYSANANNTMTGLQWAKNNIHSYYTIVTKTIVGSGIQSKETIEIDANTYANVISSTTSYRLNDGTEISVDIIAQTKTYYEYENDVNDNKRIIKILRPEFMPMVAEEMRNLFT